MTDATARKIFDKLDEINTNVNAIDKKFEVHVESVKPCREKCHAAHKAVFGNGGPGLKQKMWVIWGALGLFAVPVAVQSVQLILYLIERMKA